MENEKTVVNKTDKPNSWEVGKSGNRFKLYFNEADDLMKLIKGLEKHKVWNN